tara:strand:+ start:564 stop:1001 length:438 start_codon:yes stop_codon:yes gene_type:complete
MLSKFFQSFNEKKEINEDHSFESDLYNLIYEIIVADHEITKQEINFASELVEYYFKIPTKSNIDQFNKLADQKHFNTDISQFSLRLKTSLTYEQRMDIILICWQVLMVDGKEDQLEVSTVRKISTLLGIEDKDFILIRNRVKDSL